MTGYGRAAVNQDDFSINIEIKTVNNRFLDINLRLPGELQPLETTIKRSITGRLKRGRVDVFVQYDRKEAISYEINRPLISGYLAAMKEMKDEFALDGEPDINVIARLPNVVLAVREEAGPEFVASLESTVSAALDDLEKMRHVEGELLASELEARLNDIESRLPPIIDETAAVGEEFYERLSKRIADLIAKTGTNVEIDQGRLTQEIAFLADRADISEEITRLRAHIEHFRKIVKETKDVGKRLDFLTQELNREANTISSKSSNLTIKENALAIKSDIEKIREQVQNVE